MLSFLCSSVETVGFGDEGQFSWSLYPPPLLIIRLICEDRPLFSQAATVQSETSPSDNPHLLSTLGVHETRQDDSSARPTLWKVMALLLTAGGGGPLHVFWGQLKDETL